jgi:hypothetical protein
VIGQGCGQGVLEVAHRGTEPAGEEDGVGVFYQKHGGRYCRFGGVDDDQLLEEIDPVLRGALGGE